MDIHNFIYLDTDLLTSLWAQINNGNLTSYIEEFTSQSGNTRTVSHTSGNASAGVNLPFANGTLNTGNNQLSALVSEAEVFKSAITSVIHDDVFNKVLDYLTANGLIFEDAPESLRKTKRNPKVGEYVKVNISPRIVDMNYFSQFSAPLLEAMGFVVEDSTDDGQKIKESDIFKKPEDFFTILRTFCPSEIVMQDDKYISYLRPDFMRDKVSSLDFKYKGEYVLVGRVTKKGKPKFKPDMPKDTILYIMEQMKTKTEVVLGQLGFEYTNHTLTVSPIAIYSE